MTPTTAPTLLAISLPIDQLNLMERIAMQQERILANMNGSVWLSEDEAAARVKVSVSTIRKWRADGWLTYKKIDKIVLFRAEDFDNNIACYKSVNKELSVVTKTIKSRA